ncbi:MAG: VWA domain-containing protein [Sandaracinaceae bacterium]
MRSHRQNRATLFVCLLTFLGVGCDVGNRPTPGRDGGGGLDTGVRTPDTGTPRVDSGPPIDPFDPGSACGASTIPTEQVPGSLLIVFDKSGSMDTEVGGSTRWDLATGAINNVLTSTPDDLSAGLLLFPNSGDCSIEATPDVPIAPLTTSRAAIQGRLSSAGPGGGTPAFAALLAGYDYLDTLTGPGQRGIVLVSDGGEGCDFDMADEVFARVESERVSKNRLTFAVGLDFADNNLSTIAFNGGTARNDTCLPACTSGSCLEESDCMGAATCVQPLAGETGFCSCSTTADCVDPQTCMPPIITIPCTGLPPGLCAAANANRCVGDADCCHYNAAAGDFRADFEEALEDIARRLLDSCVFEVPRGTDPASFDPTLVNVGVTFEGEERNVLSRSSDGSTDSWNYTDGTNESLIIQGPICDRILEGSAPANVEIVLGCPTILI